MRPHYIEETIIGMVVIQIENFFFFKHRYFILVDNFIFKLSSKEKDEIIAAVEDRGNATVGS